MIAQCTPNEVLELAQRRLLPSIIENCQAVVFPAVSKDHMDTREVIGNEVAVEAEREAVVDEPSVCNKSAICYVKKASARYREIADALNLNVEVSFVDGQSRGAVAFDIAREFLCRLRSRLEHLRTPSELAEWSFHCQQLGPFIDPPLRIQLIGRIARQYHSILAGFAARNLPIPRVRHWWLPAGHTNLSALQAILPKHNALAALLADRSGPSLQWRDRCMAEQVADNGGDFARWQQEWDRAWRSLQSRSFDELDYELLQSLHHVAISIGVYQGVNG